jgi:hypothetical protein
MEGSHIFVGNPSIFGKALKLSRKCGLYKEGSDFVRKYLTGILIYGGPINVVLSKDSAVYKHAGGRCHGSRLLVSTDTQRRSDLL